MRAKLYLLILSVAGAIFLSGHMFIEDTKATIATGLEDSISRATSLYKHINRANALTRIRKAESIAKKKELLKALDLEKYEQNPDLVAENVQIELNIINRYQDPSDIIFVTDFNGIVVARNLDDDLRDTSFEKNPLISSALKGTSDEDLFVLAGRLCRVTSVPIQQDDLIIGTISFANYIDSEMAKKEFGVLDEETKGERDKTSLYFAYLSLEPVRLLGSNLPSTVHSTLKENISAIKKDIIDFRNDREKKKSLSI